MSKLLFIISPEFLTNEIRFMVYFGAMWYHLLNCFMIPFNFWLINYYSKFYDKWTLCPGNNHKG